MFVELIESLRCPRHLEGAADAPHLVASTTRSEARHIIDGVLGCPTCNAEFPIVNGVARFDQLDEHRTEPFMRVREIGRASCRERV